MRLANVGKPTSMSPRQKRGLSCLRVKVQIKTAITQKDFVKLEQFDLNNLYIMDLKIKISEKLDLKELNTYLKI